MQGGSEPVTLSNQQPHDIHIESSDALEQLLPIEPKGIHASAGLEEGSLYARPGQHVNQTNINLGGPPFKPAAPRRLRVELECTRTTPPIKPNGIHASSGLQEGILYASPGQHLHETYINLGAILGRSWGLLGSTFVFRVCYMTLMLKPTEIKLISVGVSRLQSFCGVPTASQVVPLGPR